MTGQITLQSVIEEKDISYTPDEFRKKITTFVAELVSLGARSGEIVVAHSSRPSHELALIIACLELNLCICLSKQKLNHAESNRIISHLNPHIIIDDNQNSFSRKHSLLVSKKKSGMIFQTSGTSSANRYVLHKTENLIKNAEIAGKIQKISSQSDILSTLPLCHTGGINMQVLPAILAGAKITFCKNLEYLNLLDKGCFTHVVLVPYQLRVLFARRRHLYFKTKTLILTGSTPVDSDLFIKAKAANAQLLAVYGLTEIGPFVCYSFESMPTIAGTVSLLGKMESNYQVSLTENGEILLKGPCTGQYITFKNMAWTLENCGNPWVRTKDKGILTGDYLYFSGRTNREINVGGLKFSPEEIESEVMSFAGVLECYVYPKPDKYRGQIPVIKVVGENVDIDKIIDWLQVNFSSYKIPKEWTAINKLVHTTIFKPSRKNKSR